MQKPQPPGTPAQAGCSVEELTAELMVIMEAAYDQVRQEHRPLPGAGNLVCYRTPQGVLQSRPFLVRACDKTTGIIEGIIDGMDAPCQVRVPLADLVRLEPVQRAYEVLLHSAGMCPNCQRPGGGKPTAN